MTIDTDWLADTYPPNIDQDATAAVRAKTQELVCLMRLEELYWPEGPVCPECKQASARPWNSARRGLGWRCEIPTCAKRFHVLEVIPALAHMHHKVALLFRAVYLVTNNGGMSISALGEKLGATRVAAKSLRERIDQLTRDDPLVVERIVGGPSADAVLLRKAHKLAAAARRAARLEAKKANKQ